MLLLCLFGVVLRWLSAGICDDPPHIGMADARAEAEFVLFSCLDALFASSPAVGPSDIDVLITNCSLFTPTPSLSSLLINRYKMRSDIQSYSLGGMGCSAGVIAVHLARDLLQVYRSARCLVVSTEVITQNIHLGSDPAFLVSNALFRCGASVQLYSNRASDRWMPPAQLSCKLSLEWTSRTHVGSDDGVPCYHHYHQQMPRLLYHSLLTLMSLMSLVCCARPIAASTRRRIGRDTRESG